MTTVLVGVGALAAVVGVYYLVLWALRDRRSKQAVTKIAAQVKRMQQSRALTSGASVPPVAPSSWTGEDALPTPPSSAQGSTGRAGLSRTHGMAGNDVVTTDTTRAAPDVPRLPTTAAVSALQQLDAPPTTAAWAGAAHPPTSHDPTAHDSLLTPLTTRS